MIGVKRGKNISCMSSGNAPQFCIHKYFYLLTRVASVDIHENKATTNQCFLQDEHIPFFFSCNREEENLNIGGLVSKRKIEHMGQP